jgi:alkylation response protein AidB-like acyl-CoA dehydrogenase
LLGHERTSIAAVGSAKRELARLKRAAGGERRDGRSLLDDPLFAARVARIEIDLMALEITNLRVLSAEGAARAPGPEASILKIKGSEIQQAISELMMHAAGPYALPLRLEAMEAGWQSDPASHPLGPSFAATATSAYLNQRKLSIFGGTNEIQKNIVAKMMGL